MKNLKYLKTANNKPTDKELDDLWREACISRDCGICRYTKEIYHTTITQNEAILQVHHIMKKATLRLRWELDNGITVTKGVHFSIAHSNSPTQEKQFREWALDRLPAKPRKDLELMERRKECGGVDRFAVKLYLQAMIKKFQLGG